MVIQGKKVNLNIMEIFESLKNIMPQKFRYYELMGNNIKLTCPNPDHKGGQETRPSSYLLLEDKKNYNNSVIEAGQFHCFSCQKKTNIIGFISMILEVPYNQAEIWVLQNFETILNYKEKKRPLLDLFNEGIKERPSEDLDKYEYYHDYIFDRGISKEIYDKFKLGFKPETNEVTFPVYINKELDFVAKRNIFTKFWWLPKAQDMLLGRKPVYGLNEVVDGVVIVCEGIFDALTCWTYGKQGVALFGLGTKDQFDDLINHPGIRKIILAYDGDERGIETTSKWSNYKKLLNNKFLSYYLLPKGKDLNDLSKEEFDNLKEYPVNWNF